MKNYLLLIVFFQVVSYFLSCNNRNQTVVISNELSIDTLYQTFLKAEKDSSFWILSKNNTYKRISNKINIDDESQLFEIAYQNKGRLKSVINYTEGEDRSSKILGFITNNKIIGGVLIEKYLDMDCGSIETFDLQVTKYWENRGDSIKIIRNEIKNIRNNEQVPICSDEKFNNSKILNFSKEINNILDGINE